MSNITTIIPKQQQVLVSNPVIHYYTYETLKKAAVSSRSLPGGGRGRGGGRGGGELSALSYFVLASIAKAVATLLTYPLQLAQVCSICSYAHAQCILHILAWLEPTFGL